MPKYRIIEGAHGRAREARDGARLRAYELGEREEPTARQLEVLQLASYGLTNEEIGKRLWITRNTVATHMKRLVNILGVRHDRKYSVCSRAHAVAIGLREGIIE